MDGSWSYVLALAVLVGALGYCLEQIRGLVAEEATRRREDEEERW